MASAMPPANRCQQDTKMIEAVIDSFSAKPIVPSDVAHQLLRVQARYLDEHPCLCTSRFRHILHQLEPKKKRQLALVCDQLQQLTNISAEHLYETTLCYKRLVSKIFDLEDMAKRANASTRSSTPSPSSASSILDNASDKLVSRLEAVLARLVMCYRAIFIIEDEANCFRRADCTSIYHEHRKRHEEDQIDEGPEEIKLMKVAWQDFSLGRYYEKSDNEPVVAPKPAVSSNLDVDQGVRLHHRRHRARHHHLGHVQVKKRSSRCTPPSTSSLLNEGLEMEGRRCKMDVVCSSCSAFDGCKKSWSIEDMAKSNENVVMEESEHRAKLPVVFVCGNDDDDKEVMAATLNEETVIDPGLIRGHEERLYSLSPTSSISSVVDDDDKDNDAEDAGNEDDDEDDEDDVSVDTPSINTFLEKHIEPISWMPSNLREMTQTPTLSSDTDDELVLSPSSSVVHSHLDPTHMRVDNEMERRRRRRLKHLKRQLGQVRKKLETLELNFENVQGYRPSHAEKSRRTDMKDLMAEQHTLRRQIRNMKHSDEESVAEVTTDMDNDDGVFSTSTSTSSGSDAIKTNAMDEESKADAIKQGVKDIEKRMRSQRKLKNRPQHLHQMNREQLADEKVDLQEALNRFQSAYGTREELTARTEDNTAVNMARNVYERYRRVRRLIRRSSSGLTKDSEELVTIPEHEELPLTLASPPHRIHVEIDGLTNVPEESDQADPNLTKPIARAPNEESLPSGLLSEWQDMSSWSLSPSSSSEALASSELWSTSSERLHSMGRLELLATQRQLRDFKRQLRRQLRAHEEDYRRVNGRRLSKEERDHNADQMHHVYKLTKAKMKLVGALIDKQSRFPHTQHALN